MTRDALISLALVGWFAALAIIETVWARRRSDRKGVDDHRLLTNFSLAALVLLGSSLFPLINVASALVGAGIGLAYHVPLPWIAIFALTLIAQTFAAYWVHRWMHAWPLLWRVHRVHHADASVDVSTSLRNHPLELLVTIPASALVVLVLGTPVSAVAAVQGCLVAAAIWEHADIALPQLLDRALARVLVTPRLHRLHHSPERRNHDSNYGNGIMLWDRLFGTINDCMEEQEVGLTRQRADPNRFLEQICSPLQTV